MVTDWGTVDNVFTLLLIIVIIVLFVLWRDAKKQIETKANESYEKGYSAGYWDLADRLKGLLFKDSASFDMDTLKKEIGVAEQADTKSDAPTIAEDARDDGIVQQPTQEDTRQHNAVRNLNVLLFVASLLFVAAGAAFVSAAMPDGIKLVGIWMLVLAFYAGGLFLQDSEKLRPAGVAFAGTGLGLLPFAGLALNQLANIPGELAWFVTSVVGVVAYFYAAVAMKSQVVSYLTVAFVLSFAASVSSVVALPMVWTFVAIISAGLIVNLVAYLWPALVPEVFRTPIENSVQAVVPVTIALSLLFVDDLSTRSYELLVGLSAAYYAIVWLQTAKTIYRHLVRGLAQVLVLLIVWDMSFATELAFGIGLAVTALVQQMISLLLYKIETTRASWIWIGIMQAIMLVAPLFWGGALYNNELLAIDYFLLGAMSLAVTLQFRQSIAALPGIVMSVVLPFIVGRLVFDPPLAWELLASWFVFAGGLLILGRYLVRGERSPTAVVLLNASIVGYLALGSLLAMLAVEAAPATLILLVGAVLFLVSSYVTKRTFMSVVGSIGLIAAVYQFCIAVGISPEWQAMSVLGIAGLILYGAVWYMIMGKDEARVIGLLMTFWVLSVFMITLSFFSPDTKVAAAAAIVAVAGTLALEGQRKGSKGAIEAAVYVATFGLQRLVGIGSDDISLVLYAHWWAVTIFAVGRWFNRSNDIRAKVALAFASVSSGIYALAEGGVYQILFLAEQVALLLFGASFNRQWAVWWGLIGSVLAVLWFLKDILFLAFAFLGMVVIGIVIWRLKMAGDKR